MLNLEAGTNIQDFRINLGSRWTKETGFVQGDELEGGDAGSGDDMDED